MIRRACYVSCDGVDNEHPCGAPAEISCNGAKEARRFARQEGFARVDGRDLCPACLAFTSAHPQD